MQVLFNNIELLKLFPFQEGSGNKCEKDYDNGVFL